MSRPIDPLAAAILGLPKLDPIRFNGRLLELAACPHCGRNNPTLTLTQETAKGPLRTSDHTGRVHTSWRLFVCGGCGGVIMASSTSEVYVDDYWPRTHSFSEDIPPRARNFLQQAAQTLSAPSASMMMSNSAVDSMLKARGLKTGNVSARILEAVTQGFLTKEMALWAHEVRLDANEERHADEVEALPTVKDASRVLAFAKALAEILFVLPGMVTRGLEDVRATKG